MYFLPFELIKAFQTWSPRVWFKLPNIADKLWECDDVHLKYFAFSIIKQTLAVCDVIKGFNTLAMCLPER